MSLSFWAVSLFARILTLIWSPKCYPTHWLSSPSLLSCNCHLKSLWVKSLITSFCMECAPCSSPWPFSSVTQSLVTSSLMISWWISPMWGQFLQHVILRPFQIRPNPRGLSLSKLMYWSWGRGPWYWGQKRNETWMRLGSCWYSWLYACSFPS